MSAVNKWIRIIHRWLSFIFLPTVITLLVLTITSGADFKLPVWLNLPVFGTLVLLFVTGAYLFLLHYLSKIRRNLRAKKAAAVIPVLLK